MTLPSSIRSLPKAVGRGYCPDGTEAAGYEPSRSFRTVPRSVKTGSKASSGASVSVGAVAPTYATKTACEGQSVFNIFSSSATCCPTLSER
ncbi:hypothetical protein JCM17961_18150 [Endothiovibrio diazotrophicus]